MKNNFLWEPLKKILGIILILGGIVGLFLPFFQGIVMIVAGAVLLNNKFILDKVRRLAAYFKRKR